MFSTHWPMGCIRSERTSQLCAKFVKTPAYISGNNEKVKGISYIKHWTIMLLWPNVSGKNQKAHTGKNHKWSLSFLLSNSINQPKVPHLRFTIKWMLQSNSGAWVQATAVFLSEKRMSCAKHRLEPVSRPGFGTDYPAQPTVLTGSVRLLWAEWMPCACPCEWDDGAGVLVQGALLENGETATALCLPP